VACRATFVPHNLKVGPLMPIPPVDKTTGYLPAGDHVATLEEVKDRFASNTKRRALFLGLEYVVAELRDRGVLRIWIGGSYVTDKERPGDVDVIYEVPPGVKVGGWGELAPAQRAQLKKTRDVDLWKSPSPQPGKKQTLPFIDIKDHFASDRDDRPKGLVELVEETNHD
jgi:hypothetical protein